MGGQSLDKAVDVPGGHSKRPDICLDKLESQQGLKHHCLTYCSIDVKRHHGQGKIY